MKQRKAYRSLFPCDFFVTPVLFGKRKKIQEQQDLRNYEKFSHSMFKFCCYGIMMMNSLTRAN